jgi:hypothetical protein
MPAAAGATWPKAWTCWVEYQYTRQSNLFLILLTAMTSYIAVSFSLLTDSGSNTYMPTLLLLDTGNLEVFVSHGEVRPHLLQRLISDGVDSKLLLGG